MGQKEKQKKLEHSEPTQLWSEFWLWGQGRHTGRLLAVVACCTYWPMWRGHYNKEGRGVTCALIWPNGCYVGLWSKVERMMEFSGFWLVLWASTPYYLSFSLSTHPPFSLPSLSAPEDVQLSLPSPLISPLLRLPSSRRSPERRRPCRGSHPRLSLARRFQRWPWTRTPCCAGWRAGRRPVWGWAADGAWWSKSSQRE